MSTRKLLRVKAAYPDRVGLWERHPDHPSSEVFIAGERVVEVAETAAVQRALRDGRLIAIGGIMPQIFRHRGETYTVETLHEAPGEFLLLLAERGQLPDGVSLPAGSDTPALGTIAEVLAAVELGEIAPVDALAAEQAGKGRVTLITALEAMLEEEE